MGCPWSYPRPRLWLACWAPFAFAIQTHFFVLTLSPVFLQYDLSSFAELLISPILPISKSKILPKQSLRLTTSSSHCDIFLLCLIAKVFKKFICWINFSLPVLSLSRHHCCLKPLSKRLLTIPILPNPKVSSPALHAVSLLAVWDTRNSSLLKIFFTCFQDPTLFYFSSSFSGLFFVSSVLLL